MGNLPTLPSLQLLCGFSNQEAAHFCFVSPETYRRWLHDRPANPTAIRLLAIRAGFLPWPQWRGWEIHEGFLFPPGVSRNGLAPGHINGLPYWRELVRHYQRQDRERQADALGAARRAGLS